MRISSAPMLRRTWIYIAVTVALLGSTLLWGDWASVWHVADGKGGLSDPADLHTLLETVASVLAALTGSVALVGYYTRRRRAMLFLAVGFFGAALLDSYHAVTTSRWFSASSASGHGLPANWIWNGSRTFLAILMCLSAWTGERKNRHDTRATGSGERLQRFAGVTGGNRAVLWGVAGLVLGALALFVLIPFPKPYYPVSFIGRPAELVSVLFFALAAVGYLKRGNWRQDAFEHWLMVSLALWFTTQALIMACSFQPFDTMSGAAHLLKIASYASVFAGLLMNAYQAFVQAEHDARAVLEINDVLKREMLERHEAEAELKQLAQIVEFCHDANIAKTLDGTILSWNSGAERLYGYSTDEAVGANVSMLDLREHRSDLSGILERIARGESVEHWETIRVRKDGRPVDVSVTISPIRDSCGQIVAAASIARDITARKRAEKELHALNATLEARVVERTSELAAQRTAALIMMQDAQEAKLRAERAEQVAQQRAEALARSNADLEQFAYIASHDLQEPLRKVQMFGDFLKQDCSRGLGETGIDYVNRMQSATARMQTLISDLLMFSRVSTRGKPFAPVDLSALLGEVLSDTQVLIEEAGADVRCGDLPTLDADATQMRQLLQNLIGNAIKFHKPDASPVVAVRAELLDIEQAEDGRGTAGGPWCRITIQDDGIGFDEKYLDRIFMPFQRLHGHDVYKGTGIGLAVCRKIVERHGGTLTAHSRPGEGARFIVTLPCHHVRGESHDGRKIDHDPGSRRRRRRSLDDRKGMEATQGCEPATLR